MASRAHNFRALSRAIRTTPCVFCQSRSFRLPSPTSRDIFPIFRPSRRPSRSPQSRHSYSTQIRKSPEEVRTEIDKRNRGGHYALTYSEGLIAFPPEIAESIISDFLAFQRTLNPAQCVSQLLNKYPKVELADLTNLAIVTYRTPDVNDKHKRLPSSCHKSTAKMLLLACSKAKDPEAVLHIMNALNLANSLPSAREISNRFSALEIRDCRRELEELAAKDHTDAMTLLGQFHEREGKTQAAHNLYEKALKLQKAQYSPGNDHPMALPRIPPWNALGILLLSAKDATSQEQAKTVFEKGAIEGDDPVSFYYLGTLESRENGKWLQYMSKAAAAGHLQAMYSLGHFYMDVNAGPDGKFKTVPLRDKLLARSLDWLTKFRNTGPRSYGLEWFRVAALGGHKPSMLELADLSEIEGDHEEAVKYLQEMVEPPRKEKVEEWPDLVAEAKKRLPVLRRKIAT